MTTIVYDRRTRTIAADTQNTAKDGTIFRTHKIERLKNGWFLGSGHCLTIGQCRRWAEKNFAESARPDFGVFLSDIDEYGFSCLWVSEDGSRVVLVDDEMEPIELQDNYMGVGSGASYAIGAMDAGATAEQAVAIACKRDGNSSEPVTLVRIGE